MADDSIHQIIRYDNLIILSSNLRKSLDLEEMCTHFLKSWPMITGIPLCAFALYHEEQNRFDIFSNRHLEKKLEDDTLRTALLGLETATKCHNREAAHPLLSLFYPEHSGVTSEIYPRTLKSVKLRFIYSFATLETGFLRLEHKFAQLAFAHFEQALLTHYQEHLLALQQEREAYLEKVLILNGELIKAEQIALEQADKANKANMAKTEFLANMSHELRTPMHAVINYSKMGFSRFGKEEPAKVEKYFTNIHTAGTRLMGLLNNLLDLAKLESGRMEFNFESVSLIDIFNYTMIEIDVLAKNKSIHIALPEESEAMHNSMQVQCDKTRMVQVMINLLGNAIKFSPEHSVITLSLHPTTHKEQPAILCQIDDEGEGIPQSELDSVFDKFIQSSKTKTGAGGTGLGLSICREIIEAHGGHIWAENRTPKGTRFSFIVAKPNKTIDKDAHVGECNDK